MNFIQSKRFKLAAIAIVTLSLSACFDDNDDEEIMVNNPPQAPSLSVLTQAETDIVDRLPASDPDNDPLQYTITEDPTLGTVTINSDGSYTYSPNPEVTGSDSFTYSVTDGKAPTTSVSGTISITIEALSVSFLSQSRAAFMQAPNDTPLSVNGRAYIQDVAGESDYQDLIDAN